MENTQTQYPQRAEGYHELEPAAVIMTFLEKIDREYLAYEKQTRRLRKRELLRKTEKITAYRLVYRILKRERFRLEDIAFVNQFENPLHMLVEAYVQVRDTASTSTMTRALYAIRTNQFDVSGHRLAA